MTVAVDNKDGCLNIPFKQPTRISRERTVTMYPTSDDYYKAIEQRANELFENVKIVHRIVLHRFVLSMHIANKK